MYVCMYVYIYICQPKSHIYIYMYIYIYILSTMIAMLIYIYKHIIKHDFIYSCIWTLWQSNIVMGKKHAIIRNFIHLPKGEKCNVNIICIYTLFYVLVHYVLAHYLLVACSFTCSHISPNWPRTKGNVWEGVGRPKLPSSFRAGAPYLL